MSNLSNRLVKLEKQLMPEPAPEKFSEGELARAGLSQYLNWWPHPLSWAERRALIEFVWAHRRGEPIGLEQGEIFDRVFAKALELAAGFSSETEISFYLHTPIFELHTQWERYSREELDFQLECWGNHFAGKGKYSNEQLAQWEAGKA